MTNQTRMLAWTSVLASLLLTGSQVAAQMGHGMGFSRGYYAAPTETIHGTVETVGSNAYFCRWGATQATLKTDRGTVNVILGPAAFLSQNNFSVVTGDELSATVFNPALQETPNLIAREVSKGGQTLTLRNAQGFPVWAGAAWGGELAVVGADVAVLAAAGAAAGKPADSLIGF